MSAQAPILITGSHRSGTTWAGQMLSTPDDIAYIFEPFNIEMNALNMGVLRPAFEQNYLYITDNNAQHYKERLDRLLGFHYPSLHNLVRARQVKTVGKVLKDTYLYTQHRFKSARPLVKDPLAFFSAPWLHNTYGMEVIAMSRHPAAFCSSLKVKNWHFRYENFLEQPQLMDDYLSPFVSDIEACAANKKSLVEQGIVIWNCIHHTMQRYQAQFPSWIYISHEALSYEPVDEFKTLCEALSIPFTPPLEQAILASTGSHNPAEQTQNEFVRDSRKNIKNWQKRLSADEIALIKDGTHNVWPAFYSEEDW